MGPRNKCGDDSGWVDLWFRHSSASCENGYVDISPYTDDLCTSGRIGPHRIPGEAMAFDEDFIDFVGWLLAVAGRTTRPER
jgi:hypothetical protein